MIQNVVFAFVVLLPEDGPACWYLVPALDHEGVHAAGTVLGAGQQLPGPAHQSEAGLHQSEAGLHQIKNNGHVL